MEDGTIKFSGFCVDLIDRIATLANFTFELLPPSGFGSLCQPQADLVLDDPYEPTYRTQYNCGQSDTTDAQRTNYSTDMYLSMFYVTPGRQLVSRFSTPFAPPHNGRNVMYGTATNIRTIEDVVATQISGDTETFLPVCVARGASNADFIRAAYPGIVTLEIVPTNEGIFEALDEGRCEIMIFDQPLAANFVLVQAEKGKCLANGKPIGLIGQPLSFGPNHYAIGMRKDIDQRVVDTIDFHLNSIMVCAPNEVDSVCPRGEGSLESLYRIAGGFGGECGYVQFPSNASQRLETAAVLGIIVCVVFLVIICYILLVRYKLRQQRDRIKKRFVQQIARNILIAPGPGAIPPQKLVEAVQHIGDEDGIILKEDLRCWLSDVKLEFVSPKDFEVLWAAMDINGTGRVDAVEFFIFLGSCGPQFEEVYEDEQKMSRLERLKLAARRLTVIKNGGEEAVRSTEYQLERLSRRQQRQQSNGSDSAQILVSSATRKELEKAARGSVFDRFRPTGFRAKRNNHS